LSYGGQVAKATPGLAEAEAVASGDRAGATRARRINLQAPEKFLFRPMVVTEGRDLAIPLPKLDVMPVDQTLGALDGVFLVLEGEIDAIDHVPIGIDDVSVVSVHRLACSPNQTNPLARVL
jgi:hypothetical protein